jgi:ferric-dicitrate binding protein FerR (iron transport regulator)
MDASTADTILAEIIGQVPGVREQEAQPLYRKRRLRGWQIAASTALLAGMSLIWYIYMKPLNSPAVVSNAGTGKAHDIAPGGNKAVLTLWNGTRIYLNKVHVGAQVVPGTPQAVKLGNGLLAFNRPAGHAGSPVRFNTVSTPRGGQYQIILPDGSRVWLNAESSLKFPSAFSGPSRKVTVTGEAYFEVASHAGQPFSVSILSAEGHDEGTIRVLGTRFNVNAYSDDSAVRATLLEGAIRITDAEQGEAEDRVLAPGEQAVFTAGKPLRVLRDVNVGEAVAWKNGLFDFEGNDIQSVMRQLARWYDVTVVYHNTTSAHFMGTISRYVNISEVLTILEMTGEVHFDVTEMTIAVLP